MSCTPDFPSFDSFEAFYRGLYQTGNLEAEFLRQWSKEFGFTSCATWTKKLLILLTRSNLEEASRLLTIWGTVFRGDEVGALGRDILEFALRPSLQGTSVAEAALETLIRWAVTDPLWLALLDEEDLEFEDDRQHPELEAQLAGFFEVSGSKPNRIQAVLETRSLPGFLEKNARVRIETTLGLLESLQVGCLVVTPPETLPVVLSHGAGGEPAVRAWHMDGSLCFSVEPTAVEGLWLVFVRF